ncbi:hypothetical protein ACQKPE_01295 [Pseudomonas sp. NPDC089554]|uniref:hypothetical protein n=1 Tax=Pseudomonas sp. NPDC089554 TaxID=3390653 RepID=UPI003D00296E
MLKIVPDPPLLASISLHILEDLLVQLSEHLLCAHSIAHQAIQLDPRPPGHHLTMATLHELDSARSLLEQALAHAQPRD